MMRTALAWLLCLLPCAARAAAPAPDAMDILRRTAAVYRDVKGYEFRLAVQTIQAGNATERHFTESGSQPGRFRSSGDAPQSELRIGDGRVEWTFDPKTNQYSQAPLTPDSRTPVSEFAAIDRQVSRASVARQEQFLVNGKPVPVFVVRVARSQWPLGTPAGTEYAMYRIDQKTSVVHKAIFYSPERTEIRLYTIVKWNQPAADSLFAFTPPANARVASVVASSAAASSSIVGSEAPDFTLKDTAGRPARLRDLAGKVVVVDFWATWCPPCRALMPHLQKMHEQYADRGLVVLGLDVGEDAETVTRFAGSRSFTFTLLLGAEPDIAAKYYVEAYPTTFVIGRDGRIAFREVGGESPEKLREAVETALGSGAAR